MIDAQRSAMGGKRVVVIAASGRSLARNRDDLIRALRAASHEVLCITFDTDSRAHRDLRNLGATVDTYVPRKSPLGWFGAWQASRGLTEMVRSWGADVVLACGGRDIADAVSAAKRGGTARIVWLVTTPLHAPGTDAPSVAKSRSLSRAEQFRLVRAFAAADVIVAHNPDLQRQICNWPGVDGGIAARCRVVPGAGVDLMRHQVAQLPAIDDGIVFLMIAARDRRRGSQHYGAAAREVRARSPKARFLFAGPAAGVASGPPAGALADFADVIEDHGEVDDVRPLLSRAHVFVYPSLAEGLPRATTEALAAGRPVITTTAPGCRETVDDRVNGWLVGPGDTSALAAGLEGVLKRPDLIVSAARASRSKAERCFDVRAVNRALFDAMGMAAVDHGR